MADKSYATNKELGLNANGIKVPFFNKGPIPPSAPQSPHHVANDGGHIRVQKDQTGWQVRCSQVGSCGGFDISIGSAINKTLMPGITDQVDFSVDVAENLKVDHIGMLSRDWGALVITRLF